ncbi:hypothetical protein WAI453_009194 [Rhynchosporium graminicola]
MQATQKEPQISKRTRTWFSPKPTERNLASPIFSLEKFGHSNVATERSGKVRNAGRLSSEECHLTQLKVFQADNAIELSQI